MVDEAQNLTPLEVKTIVTRVGEGTKVVFTGDPYQIDNPYVDAKSNGLTWLVEKLKGQPLVGHMTLTKESGVNWLNWRPTSSDARRPRRYRRHR